MGPVPEEGVSRLVTQQISERRDYYVRYGLAFMIEHGFMQSPKGQMTYRANLEQIRDAILSSLYIGVIESLLRCKTNSQFFITNYGRTVTALSARRRIELECEAWGEIQKTDHGWEMLNSRAQRALKLQGVTPDAWVVDDGVKKYIACRRENWAYFLHGAEGEKLRQQNQALGNPQMLDVAANTLIFETKQFQLPNEDDPVNITSRRRTIGEYAVSFPHLDYSSCGKYNSSMRDIMMYDEDRDGFTKISIGDGIAACQRFDPDSGDLDSYGFTPDTDTNIDGSDGTDMFFTPEHPHGVDYFAEMHKEHMPDGAINDWVHSVVQQFDEKTRSDLVSDLETMYALVDKLEGAPTQMTDEYEKYFTYLRECYTNASTAATPTNLDAKTGIPKLGPLLTIEGVTSAIVPYGYASYAGICAMAEMSPDNLILAADAKRAKKAIDTIRQKMDGVCYGNLFTQESSIPFYVKDKCTAAGVFSNVLHKRLPPLVIQGGLFDISSEEVTASERKAFCNQLSAKLILSKFDTGMDDQAMDKATKLSKKVAERVCEVAANMSERLREKLVKILDKISSEEQMEKAYKLFMQGLDGHDWYSMSRAVEDAGNFDDFIRRVNGPKTLSTDRIPTGPTAAGSMSGSPKDAITPLTCSDVLRDMLPNDFFKYESLPGMFPPIQAGEVGDEEGVRARDAPVIDEDGREGTRRMFGIKRRQADREDQGGAAPTIGAWWFDPEHKDIKTCVERVHSAFSSKMERAFAMAFIGNAVNLHTLKRFVSTGCVIPFNLIYARPYQTYSASTGICMKAGASTGETLVGHADFQLGDNVIQKLHYGNFSVYTKVGPHTKLPLKSRTRLTRNPHSIKIDLQSVDSMMNA